MGLFDFLRNVGNDIFGGDDEAEKINELITTELGDKVKDLKVEYDDGLVSLSGSCDSQEVKEKAVLLAGNLKGVEKVNDERLAKWQIENQEPLFFINGTEDLPSIKMVAPFAFSFVSLPTPEIVRAVVEQWQGGAETAAADGETSATESPAQGEGEPDAGEAAPESEAAAPEAAADAGAGWARRDCEDQE